MMRWVATDVTTNPKVQQELQDFFLQHGVKQVAMTEGNLGCPHEEGEDFPHGEDCPFCPFCKGKQGSKPEGLMLMAPSCLNCAGGVGKSQQSQRRGRVHSVGRPPKRWSNAGEQSSQASCQKPDQRNAPP